ncbi:DUF262 domain-containing protein [Serratia fonticola]|uniref:DUF262 domain-containing protein n=1 Tax=Serratia fonticola TaxID=47917 RepID=UPI001377FCB0|nr:DUF262 domain-containing protein [Serratia fonticola]NCG53485.1 DUF262 domain-containing protein [Serratia fonticola]
MTKKWVSTTHPISDIRDWNVAGTLILQPDYQRREVWGIAAKIMLIDSIMNAIPMPKIFVSSHIQNGRTVRAVIDGQQRITAILGFLNNEFSLDDPYSGECKGLFFRQLPESIQDNVILAYDIDFNEAKGLSDIDLREVYSRVNKYLVALNKQELRKADYPGDFLNVCEAMANHDYFDEAGVFTAAARRRSLDVEFTSELVGALVIGVSERKDAIDSCYQKYSVWDPQERDALKDEFEGILNDISKIFLSDIFPIRKTRWKQKADFYSLFIAISQLRKEGFSLLDNTELLRNDLEFIGPLIAPTSNVNILSKYALYCVSQANSAASRRWRTNFLKGILRGTYARNIDDVEQRKVIFNLAVDIRWSNDDCFPLKTETCKVCGKSELGVVVAEAAIVWPMESEVFQLSNIEWVHRECADNVDNIIAILPEEFGYFDDMDEE